MRTYLRLMRLPGAGAFVAAGFIARLPIAMTGLGIVLLVTSQGSSYAVAGAMASTFALAAAFVSPLGLRWADRSGQRRTVPVLATAESVALLAFTATAAAGGPVAGQFAALAAAGCVAPHIGSLVRARWASLLAGRPELGAAFALEAVVDELVFIVGPVLMTYLALQIGETVGLIVCAALIVVGALWLAAQSGTQPPHRARGDHPSGRMLSATFISVIALMVLLGGVFGSFEVTTIAFCRELGHAPLTGVVLALYALGSLISGLTLGAAHLSSATGGQVVMFSAAAALVGVPILAATGLWQLMALAFLAGMSVAPLLILTTLIIERTVPADRLTEAFGVSTSGLIVGVSLGTVAAGALVDGRGGGAGFVIMAGCSMALLLLSLAARGPLGGNGMPDAVDHAGPL